MKGHHVRVLFTYVVQILLPLLPVTILYRLFGSLSYFGLEGWMRGVIASGPIAAYFYMIHVSFRYFRDLVRTLSPTQSLADAERLVGRWSFESTTNPSGKTANGEAIANIHNGQLVLTGKLIGNGGTHFGELISELCLVDISRAQFKMLYKATTLDADRKPRFSECFCSMMIADNGKSISKLEGYWLQLSIDGQSYGGPVVFRRTTAPSEPS
jgi:hypothetical protein